MPPAQIRCERFSPVHCRFISLGSAWVSSLPILLRSAFLIDMKRLFIAGAGAMSEPKTVKVLLYTVIRPSGVLGYSRVSLKHPFKSARLIV